MSAKNTIGDVLLDLVVLEDGRVQMGGAVKTRYVIEYQNKSEWPVWRAWREPDSITREGALAVAADLVDHPLCGGVRVIEYQPMVIWQRPEGGE